MKKTTIVFHATCEPHYTLCYVNYDVTQKTVLHKTQHFFIGVCHQINSNGSLNATSSGKSGGITLVLSAEVEDYSTGPRSYSEGFSVSH